MAKAASQGHGSELGAADLDRRSAQVEGGLRQGPLGTAPAACLLLALSSFLPAALTPACIAYVKQSLRRGKEAINELGDSRI